MLRGDKLGEGGFGIVYSALSPTSKQEYAVKRNLTEKNTSFIGSPREIDILNRLREHPFIVRIEKVYFNNPFENNCFSPLIGNLRDSQRDDTIHFIFGKATSDLYTYIYKSPTINFSQIKSFMMQLLLGLEYMHSQKIIHRDLKPHNILVFGDVIKICDFGMAKPYTYQGIQTPNVVTSWYRAPEILLGYPHYDYKSDIWSMGCVLFEMIARKPFITTKGDNSDDVLSDILGALSKELPMRKFRELVSGNKWRTVSLRPNSSPTVRKSCKQRIGITDLYINYFNDTAGSFEQFTDLLEYMLCFEWDKRPSIKECLAHPFFSSGQYVIEDCRKKYPLDVRAEQKIIIHRCIERYWMYEAATDLYNKQNEYYWYKTRALFQAMDLFDRYLSVMFHAMPPDSNQVESESKGLIHDKMGAKLRFYACFYLCIKFFSSLHYAVSFESILPEEYRTQENLILAEQFEGSFVINCLSYEIYRPTLYECADDFGDTLTDEDIRDLTLLYAGNNSFNGMTHSQLYQIYREKLKGKEQSEFLKSFQ